MVISYIIFIYDSLGTTTGQVYGETETVQRYVKITKTETIIHEDNLTGKSEAKLSAKSRTKCLNQIKECNGYVDQVKKAFH